MKPGKAISEYLYSGGATNGRRQMPVIVFVSVTDAALIDSLSLQPDSAAAMLRYANYCNIICVSLRITSGQSDLAKATLNLLLF